MRKIIFAVFILLCNHTHSQINKIATNEFIVTGKVKNEKIITLTDLKNYPITEINNINTSCSPKREEKAKSIKVVLLKNVLDSVRFDYENSRMLGQYYFLFISSDGYKIVFSFNEVYNTEIGNNLFVVVEMDGKKIEDMESRIMLLSTKDIKGGSRNMKGLSKIVVCKAD